MKNIKKGIICGIIVWGLIFGNCQCTYAVDADINTNPAEATETGNTEEAIQEEISVETTIDISVLSDHIYTTSLTEKLVRVSWDKVAFADGYRVYLKNKTKDKDFTIVSETLELEVELSVKKNESYIIKLAPLQFSELGVVELGEGQVNFINKSFVSIDHQKYTYKEMESDINSLAKKYHDYISCQSIGKTKNGRKIYDVVLGNREAKKTLLVVCAIHAREYVTTAIVMKQLEYYLQNYNNSLDGVKVSEVFANCNVHYIMMANPDGVTISQTKNSRWKANANGVNLNANFPSRFKKEGSKKKGNYSGKKAASENETKAIIKLTKKLMAQEDFAVVNYHAMGNIIFGDTKGCSKSLKETISKMYAVARKTTGYKSAAGYGGSGNGNYREYLMYELKIPSITVEVGSVACPLPTYYYKSIFEKNKLVILREAQIL